MQAVKTNMKRSILAALVALAIALAAPAAMAYGYPKPPRWTQAEEMYWNNNVTLRHSFDYSEGAPRRCPTTLASKGGSTGSYSSPAVMI